MGLSKKAPQVLVGLAFLGAGGQKLAGTDQMVRDFERYGYPQWFRVATGVVETSGALGMLLGLFRPKLVPFAGLLLGANMVGALATHASIKDPVSKVLPGFYQNYADWLPVRYSMDGLRSLLFYDGDLATVRLGEEGARDAFSFIAGAAPDFSGLWRSPFGSWASAWSLWPRWVTSSPCFGTYGSGGRGETHKGKTTPAMQKGAPGES